MNPAKRSSLSLGYIVLAVVVAVGLGAGIVRLVNGLGMTTALSDGYPWGLWIVYDVFFVPFCAGAFMILAITHIYGKREYHRISRPVVVAGFLGELMVIAILLMDLGRWHQFYNVLLPWNWNIRSFMFQVSICLTVYMGIMVLEVAPAVLERLNWQKPLRYIKMATIVIAGLGIVLSSLHQSSLGSLFLLMPYKLHALWWTPLLPLLFFASAAFAGLSMAIFVVTLSFKAFRRPLELDLLSNLARIVAVLLGMYLVLKLVDLLMAGELGLVFTEGKFSALFLAEIVIGVIVPMILFTIHKVRESDTGLIVGSAAVLVGVALNRTNVALLAYQAPAGAYYIPNWMEILIAVSAVAAGVLLFALAVRFLPILPKGNDGQEEETPVGWSRRAVIFVGGALSLLTLAVVFLLLPMTEATASKAPETDSASMPPAVGEYPAGSCQSCHLDANALREAGADVDRLSALGIDPQPADSAHGRLDCVVCHYGNKGALDKTEAHVGRIIDPTLGEAKVCVACHSDLPDEFPDDRLRTPHDQVTHSEAAGVVCSDCHGGVGHGFDPVSGEIICPMGVCLDCHVSRQLDAALTDCAACHMGAHEQAAELACSECHRSTDAWKAVEAGDHPLQLEGGHAQATCLDCHLESEGGRGSECANCHRPPDGGHYGADCQECHTSTGFAEARLPDHPLALVGAHQTAACADCHVDGGQSIEYVCSNCHTRPDGHLSGRCEVCHTPAGWAESVTFVTRLTPLIPHGLEGKSDCLMCHDLESEILPAPSNHGDYENEQCVLCHKSEQ
jgi:Ni/Fe-hydrogenase subunit HybB-like protein